MGRNSLHHIKPHHRMFKNGEVTLKCLINGNLVREAYFWHSLEGVTSPTQKHRLLDGCKLLIGGIIYQIIFE